MRSDRNLALAAAAILAMGLTACGSYSRQSDTTTARQLSAAGEAERRGPVTTASDATITGKVKAALAVDELVKARRIDVDTLRGVVQLNGTVSSQAEKERALSIARGISGVVEVRDNLRTGG